MGLAKIQTRRKLHEKCMEPHDRIHSQRASNTLVCILITFRQNTIRPEHWKNTRHWNLLLLWSPTKKTQTSLLNSGVIHHKTSCTNSWTQEWRELEEECCCTREFVGTKLNVQSMTPSHTQAAAAPIIHLVAETWFPYTCRITLPSLTTSNWAIWEWEKLHKSIMSEKTKEKKKTLSKT